jgi:hypothetical protein
VEVGAVVPDTPVNIYAEKSDQQLTELAAAWDDLDAQQRGALLSEVKLRMVRQRSPGGVILVRSSRRYGRIIRQPDGSVLRIERRVVRVQEVDVDELPRSGFGVGFERRHGQEGLAPGTQTASAADGPSAVPEMTTTPVPVLRTSAPQR